MTWTAASPVPSSHYDIYIVTANIAPNANSTPTLFSTTNLNTTLYLNVAAGTTYYYWVRSNCGATTGVWVSGGSFTTPPALICNGAIYGLYPNATFTPACTGSTEQIVADAYAGEYSNVNVLSNKQYTFTSSVSTDFITITNATGTAILASGLTPLTWLSGTTSGVIRYHLNTNSSCGTQSTNRVKSITCATISICNAPTQLFYDGLTSTTNNIAWVAPIPAPSNGYIYCYSTVNDPFSANAITGTTTETYAELNNLSPNTTYYFWVKSICGTTQTDWVSGGSFTTQMLTTESFLIKKLKLYPNPVKDILNLSFNNEITTISIYNLLGQEVIIKSVNSNETSIDITGLAAGTYLVKVTSNNEVKTVKIIKE